MPLPNKLTELFKKYDITPSKRFGQNFLIDDNIAHKIVRQARISGKTTIIEVGPGLGQLTRIILGSVPHNQLHVIEYDKKCLAYLYDLEKEYQGKLHVVAHDALKFDERSLLTESDSKFTLISNLPYNISVVLLLKWLKSINLFDSMVLMFQREVAERIAAKPHSKAYGVVSILTQYLCEVEICFHVPPTAFFPAPKIESSVVLFKPKKDAIERMKLFETLRLVCNAAFSQRRKMAKNTLLTLIPNISEILQKLSIPETTRPEDLSVTDFERICALC